MLNVSILLIQLFILVYRSVFCINRVATNAIVGALVFAVISKLVSSGQEPTHDDFEKLNSDIDEAR